MAGDQPCSEVCPIPVFSFFPKSTPSRVTDFSTPLKHSVFKLGHCLATFRVFKRVFFRFFFHTSCNMSTMGLVYCSSPDRNDLLLRTLQENDRNITANNNNNNNRPTTIVPKNNVSVINVNNNVAAQQMQNENDNSRKQQQQQQMPAYDPSRLKKHGKNGQPPPIAVAKRNARERNRVKQVWSSLILDECHVCFGASLLTDWVNGVQRGIGFIRRYKLVLG